MKTLMRHLIVRVTDVSNDFVDGLMDICLVALDITATVSARDILHSNRLSDSHQPSFADVFLSYVSNWHKI
jgi:hypothetical protein